MFTTSIYPVQNTGYKAVVPFYLYAAIALLVATVCIFLSPEIFKGHYFNPEILAITHCMVLGWGTMIIMGASYQLLPVLTEKKLYSEPLAWCSFITLGSGIPLLLYGFYSFDMGWPAQWGGILVNVSVLIYIINLVAGIISSKDNVHAVYIFTAALWLFITTLTGLALVFNFTVPLLSENSLHYLSLHAHMGIAGWFLMLITGVATRLIPMFLISKYTNLKLLWLIYILLNSGLISFVVLFIYFPAVSFIIPLTIIIVAVLATVYYCYKCYQLRVRNQTDLPMKLSLLSVGMIVLPLMVAVLIAIKLSTGETNTKMVMLYGFMIFFGWLTALIFGMTFKTLPFIIWNKVYGTIAGTGDTPLPKDLFSSRIFTVMIITYLSGFIFFIAGLVIASDIIFKMATFLLFTSAILYDWNVVKLIFHRPAKYLTAK